MVNVLRILAFVQLFITLFGALVGSFADGGQWWDRLVLVGVHPVTAVLLLTVLMRREVTRMLAGLAVLFLSINVAGDVALSSSIVTGAAKGDWWLPLVFAVIPLIALPHCISVLRRV